MRRRFAKTTLLAACAAQGLLGCSDSKTPDTFMIAQELGAGIATPGGGGEAGALVDAAILARGGRPVGFTQDASGIYSGSHDDRIYTYVVYGAGTNTVQVVAEWPGRTGMWTFDQLGAQIATVRGASRWSTETTQATSSAALSLDTGSYDMAAGQITFDVRHMGMTANALLSIQPDRSALILVDGATFGLDLATGEVSRPVL